MEVNNNTNEVSEAKKKRNRDQFYVILAGLIGYGLILIAIVIGTFFIIRNTFNKKDAEVARAVAGSEAGTVEAEPASDTDENTTTEEAVPESPSEPVQKEEPVVTEHGADPSEYSTNDGAIDYSITLFKPGKRDATLKWKDTVFSRLENVKSPKDASVNTFRMQRKYSRLADDRELELCIYSNPSTNETEKITAIETGQGRLLIIDYYYDQGVINYVAERGADIDYPIDISSGKVTSRYYFSNDSMVKYSYCEDDKATVFSAASLKDYSQGTVEQYEYLEEKMINKAYITYNAAAALDEVQYIEGYILDEYEQALADVSIKVFDEADMTEVAGTATDGDGHYRLGIPVNNDASYMLSAYKESLDEARIYGVTAVEGSGTYFVPTPRMTYSDDGAEYNVQVVVRDSVDNSVPITDASIRLRQGLDCKEGDVVASSVLDATGAAMFTMQTGNYTAEVSKGGYENSYFNVVVTMNRLQAIGYAVKDIADDELQIITAWDTTPLDLDAWLIYAGAENVIRPVQDSVGSVNTETVTVKSDDKSLFRYYVSDYSDSIGNDPNSGNMTSSGARVYVYSNEGLIAAYHVPLGHLGVVWEPFMYRNGTVIPVNHYYNAIEAGSYFTSK